MKSDHRVTNEVLIVVALFALFCVLLGGCSNFADQTKVWEQGCHVIVDGVVAGGPMGASGSASVHKECWPDGQDHSKGDL